MITESDARRIAEAELATYPAVITHVVEEERGWEFHWNSAAYVKTGDTSHRLIGNVPFPVSRQEWSIIWLILPTIPTDDPGVVAIQAGSLPVPRKRAEWPYAALQVSIRQECGRNIPVRRPGVPPSGSSLWHHHNLASKGRDEIGPSRVGTDA